MSTPRSLDLADCKTRAEIEAHLRPWLLEYIEDVIRQRRTEVLLAAEHDDALDDVETQDRVFDRIRESSAENIEELITRVRAFLESEDSNPRH